MPATYTLLPYGSSLAMAPMAMGAPGTAGFIPVGLAGQSALQQQAMMAAPQFATMANGTAALQQPMPHLATAASLGGRGQVAAAYTATANGSYQPVLYWYPSPPVSPQQQQQQQATYYMPQSPTTVVMKGLPYAARDADVLQFLDGVAEVCDLLIIIIIIFFKEFLFH